MSWLDVRVTKALIEAAAMMAAVKKATIRALKIAGFEIRQTAQESIESEPIRRRSSLPGQPPKTHRGNYLRRAILYSVEEDTETLVAGPSFNMVGTSARAHEFGGEYKGQEYPERPFMGPALEKNLQNIPLFWSNQVTS